MRRTVLALVLTLALAAALVACGGDSTGDDAATSSATPAGSQTTPANATVDAAAIYAGNCAGCHGADGSGGSAPSIVGEDNVDRIREQVQEGGDGMPSFSGTLTAPQIDALAQFVAGGLQ